MTNLREIIESRLQDSFSPEYLQVIDESDKHAGHAGHQEGGRHFAIIIKTKHFDDMPRVKAHRHIYALFADLMPAPLHALRITIKKTPLL